LRYVGETAGENHIDGNVSPRTKPNSEFGENMFNHNSKLFLKA
jgi:hypothetical protein